MLKNEIWLLENHDFALDNMIFLDLIMKTMEAKDRITIKDISTKIMKRFSEEDLDSRLLETLK